MTSEGRVQSCCEYGPDGHTEQQHHDASPCYDEACRLDHPQGRLRHPEDEGRGLSSETLKIVVTDTHEYHVTIDLNDPRWAHLREDSSNPDEWVAALDEEAQEPDSDLARLVREMSVTDAWREVTHGD